MCIELNMQVYRSSKPSRVVALAIFNLDAFLKPFRSSSSPASPVAYVRATKGLRLRSQVLHALHQQVPLAGKAADPPPPSRRRASQDSPGDLPQEDKVNGGPSMPSGAGKGIGEISRTQVKKKTIDLSPLSGDEEEGEGNVTFELDLSKFAGDDAKWIWSRAHFQVSLDPM